MMIYCLFITRKHETDVPELVDAWDEYTIEENPDGYQDAILKWKALDDVDAFAIVGFKATDRTLIKALYPEPVVIEADVKRVELPPELSGSVGVPQSKEDQKEAPR